MTRKETEIRIKKLRKEIDHHRYLYHVLDKQEISDAAVDSLKHELVVLEEQYPDLITPDSPSQRVAGKALDKFVKVKHTVPQWSFNDAFSEDEIREFDARVKRFLSDKGIKTKSVDYTVELKIDGVHLVLTYEKGQLAVGATRGDGKVGENVTLNVKTIESIPLKLKQPVSAIVEGEAYMAKSVFEKLNKQLKKEGKPLFANPRNITAGSLRQLDPKITASRKLNCFLYDISAGDMIDDMSSQADELTELKTLGFKVNNHWAACKNIDEVIEYWKKWQTKKDKEDYWYDGVVVKVNRRDWQDKLGYTGKAPRWAIAFKFPAEQMTTIIKDITVQVGRTGALTPIAELDPVFLAGTTVKRATLHNIDQIQRLDIRIGDTVIIQKAGDIIPEVVSVLPSLRPKGAEKYQMPEKCPVCGSSVKRPKGEVAIYCGNLDCYAQRRRGVSHVVSKGALNIDGLGPKIVDKLFEAGLIKDAADIYALKFDDLMGLESFKEKASQNLIDAIDGRRTVPLERFVYGLGIRLVGAGVAELIVKETVKKHWLNVKELSVSEFIRVMSKLSVDELASIEGVGPKVADSIVGFFKDRQNQDLLDKFVKHRIQLEVPHIKRRQPLEGLSFVLTGSLPTLSRDEATALIKDAGGHVSGSVSSKTDFVVAGEDPGSKYDKAKQLGVKIIGERELKTMI